MKIKRLEIKLSEYMYDLLIKAADSKQMSKSEYVRDVLTKEIDKLSKDN